MSTVIRNHRNSVFATILSLCLLLAAFSVASGAAAADPPTADQPAVDVVGGQTDPPAADQGGEPVDPAPSDPPPADPPPADPPPADPPADDPAPTEPTGPVVDSTDPPPSGAGVGGDQGTGAGDQPTGNAAPGSDQGNGPSAEDTVTEDDPARSDRRTASGGSTGQEASPALDFVTSADAPSGGLGQTSDAAERVGDQLRRNAEAGVAASIVITRIVSEIPQWVFWALGVLALVALAGLALYVRELHRRRSAEQEAMVDQLTGISNRKAFDRRLDLEWRRAARYGRSLGLMVMDLDGFKQVNDVKGHAAGDRVLRDVGAALDGRMRDTDLVARIGGDEFAVICPETGINELLTIRRQLAQQVASSVEHGVGLSIGVAEFVPSDQDASSILARADESMYRVKRGDAALTTA